MNMIYNGMVVGRRENPDILMSRGLSPSSSLSLRALTLYNFKANTLSFPEVTFSKEIE